MNLISEMVNLGRKNVFENPLPPMYEEVMRFYENWKDPISDLEGMKDFVDVSHHELGISARGLYEVFKKAVELHAVPSTYLSLLKQGLGVAERKLLEVDEDPNAFGDEDDFEEKPTEDVPEEDPNLEKEPALDEPETEEPAPAADKPKAPEIQYLGHKRDKFYNFQEEVNDQGETTDLVIVDAEGKRVLSAKDRGMDLTQVEKFLRDVTDGLELDEISPDILKRYNYFNILPEPEPEAEELMPEEGESVGKADTLPTEDFEEPELAPMESISVMRESRMDVLSKAGVDTEGGDWFRLGNEIYFRGVPEATAREIASQLGGRLISAKKLQGIKFYSVVLESKDGEVFDDKQSFLKAIKESLVKFKPGESFFMGDKDAAREFAKTYGGKITDVRIIKNKPFYKVVIDGNPAGAEESVSEEYDVLASGLSDPKLADDIARTKNGVKIQDPKDKTKFLVIAQDTKGGANVAAAQ